MTKLFDKRREYVNKKFGDLTRGKSISAKKRSKILRKLWNQAKKNIK